MAVKKKEKPAQGRQSEIPGGQKISGSVPLLSSLKSKHGGEAAKSNRSKTNNPQKMKSGEEQKGVKLQSIKLPIMQSVIEAGQFLSEVRAEAAKISWPERSQVIRETVSVLFLVTLITLFVWLFDLTVAKFVFSPLEHLGHLYGLGGTK